MNDPATEWYVCKPDGRHAGPLSTDQLARAILDGKLARDAHVAASGDARWVEASTVPTIAAALRSLQTAPDMKPDDKKPDDKKPDDKKPDDKKPDDKKPAPLPPRWHLVPYAIFGAFAFVSLVVAGLALALGKST